MAIFEQALFSTILGGFVDALIALGFALALDVLKIPNFGHGAVVVAGIYLSYVAASHVGLSPLAALVPVMIAVGCVGLAYYALVVRPLLARAQNVHVVTTLGTMIVIEAILTYLFTSTAREVPGISLSSIKILSAYVPDARLIAAGIALVALLIVGLALTRTNIGLAVRACVSDVQAAALSGIKVKRTFVIAFVTTVMAAAVAGVALSLYTPVSPTDDVTYLTIAFAVFVVAGTTRLGTLIAAGFLISAVTQFGSTYISATYSEAILFGAIAVVLLVKPKGLSRWLRA
jgi:branched-chain amino acid transport system permease protein